MPSVPYNIAEIERYLTHRMERAERAEFEARLQQDEGYRQELAAYQSLLEGFQALRSENFGRQMNQWEEKWKEANTDDTELIEWYLNDELTGKARDMFEQRIKQDEALARELAGYRQIQEGFEAARAENFHDKLREWESIQAQPAIRRRLWPRIAAAAAILLLLGLGSNWYLQANFSSNAIAEAYYKAPMDSATMGGEAIQEDIAERFASAHDRFEQKQYPAAFEAFDALLAQLPNAPLDELSRSHYREQSEWNRLLAALAVEPPPFDVRAEAQRLASADGHEFQQAARELLRKLQSPWYQWVN